MYDRKKISKKLLAAGLFRIAYGVDAFRDDLETVHEMFVFCAVALEENGWDPAVIVDILDSDQFDRAEWVMNAVDSVSSTYCREYSEALLLLVGLNEMLNTQFSASEKLERGRFLKDLDWLANRS